METARDVSGNVNPYQAPLAARGKGYRMPVLKTAIEHLEDLRICLNRVPRIVLAFLVAPIVLPCMRPIWGKNVANVVEFVADWAAAAMIALFWTLLFLLIVLLSLLQLYVTRNDSKR